MSSTVGYLIQPHFKNPIYVFEQLPEMHDMSFDIVKMQAQNLSPLCLQ